MKKIALFLILIIFTLNASTSILNDVIFKNNNSDYLKAKELFNNREYKKSAGILFDIIQKENNKDAFQLFGYQLEYGLGVEQNCKLAAGMYFSSIKLGNCNAFNNLIDMVKKNHCIKKSKKNKITIVGLKKELEKCLSK